MICSTFRSRGSDRILLPPNRWVWKRQNQRCTAEGGQPTDTSWNMGNPSSVRKSFYYEGDQTLEQVDQTGTR